MMLALLASDWAILAIAGGTAAAAVVLVVIWMRPRRATPLWALASLVIVGLVGVGVVAAFKPPGNLVAQTVGSTGGRPAAEPTTPPTAAPPSSTPQGSPPTSTAPAPGCEPSGTTVQVSAEQLAFDADCLAAPADTAFTIDFRNEDAGIPHNVHILAADPATDPNAESLFTGDVISGPAQVDYQVQGLPPGTYFFQCDVHPTTMRGTFAVP